MYVLSAYTIDCTYLAPAAYSLPREHTAKYPPGRDVLIANAQQDSRISMEDNASAPVDEFEPGQRR